MVRLVEMPIQYLRKHQRQDNERRMGIRLRHREQNGIVVMDEVGMLLLQKTGTAPHDSLANEITTDIATHL